MYLVKTILHFFCVHSFQSINQSTMLPKTRAIKQQDYAKPVLWIRIGFNADPDPAFISIRTDP
jgi:hypothetical protein